MGTNPSALEMIEAFQILKERLTSLERVDAELQLFEHESVLNLVNTVYHSNRRALLIQKRKEIEEKLKSIAEERLQRRKKKNEMKKTKKCSDDGVGDEAAE